MFPVVTLSTQDHAKLLQQVKYAFKRTINWNKYQSDPKTHAQKQYLNRLIDPSFQGVNRLFLLSFENENGRTSHLEYYLPKLEIKDYNVMTDGKNIDQQVKNDKITYENIQKIGTCQKDDYTAGCLLDYPYVKENYKMIAIDLCEHQARY